MKLAAKFAAAILSLTCLTGFGRESIPSDPDAWTNAPLGIAITKVKVNSYGYFCDFVTDLPPPYYVGVYQTEEIQFGGSRVLPFKEVETWKTNGVYIGSGLIQKDRSCFIQVMSSEAHNEMTNLWAGVRHELTEEEKKEGAEQVEKSSGFYNEDPNASIEFDRNMLEEWNKHGQLVADNTWVMFVETNASVFAFDVYGTIFVKDPGGPGHIETNDTYSVVVTNGCTDVGIGYRVVLLDDRHSIMAQRAYSPRPNMSSEVVLPRIVSSLSAHRGYRVTTDLYGHKYFQKDTNAIPDKVYWEGLNRKSK